MCQIHQTILSIHKTCGKIIILQSQISDKTMNTMKTNQNIINHFCCRFVDNFGGVVHHMCKFVKYILDEMVCMLI